MSISQTTQLNADLCRTRATECLELAEEAVSRPQRIMLQHIGETWYRIAGSFDV
jgi:hypothetical protein